MNRARIREIADAACAVVDTRYNTRLAIPAAVESAILRAIEELLTQEPSEAMLEAGGKFLHIMSVPKIEASSIYRAMTEQLLKEVKGE